jgi:pyridoxine/pyridoxamine 5'-phosphate oxidase
MQAVSNDLYSFQCKCASMDKTELLSYIRARKLAVIGTTGPDGRPQGALVGVGVTDGFQIIFNTASDSRKHQNLQRDTRIAATFSGPGEQTLQVEGRAKPVASRNSPMRAERGPFIVEFDFT